MQSDLERHLANRAELLAARASAEAKWDAELAALQTRRDEHMGAFDRGLADADAVIVAAGGEVPAEPVGPEQPAPAESAPEPEHA